MAAAHKVTNAILTLVFLSRIISIRGQIGPACAGARNGQFVKSSESCGSYYYCDNEIAVAAHCPTQYYFNPKTEICDHKFNVDCTQCSPNGIQNIEDPNDCRWYYRCVAGTRTHRPCTVGLVFDPHIGDCNVEGLTTCHSDNSMCSQYSHMPFFQFGDPYDCTRYYTCLNGITFRQSCAPNLYYNAHVGYCDKPGTFNFCQNLGPIITPPPTTNNPTQSVTPMLFGNGNNPLLAIPQTGTVEYQQSQQQQPPARLPVFTQPPMVTRPVVPTPPAVIVTTKSPQANEKPPLWAGENVCTQANGNFPIPESCTSYVRCTNGVQLYPVITCPEGTFFSATYQDCIGSAVESCFTTEFLNSDCKKDIGYFGVAGWCNKYVFCEDGRIKNTYECTSNSYWNQAIGGCSLDKPFYC